MPNQRSSPGTHRAASPRSNLLSKRGAKAGVEMTYAARAKTSGSIYKHGVFNPEGEAEHAPPHRRPTRLTSPASLRVSP